MAVRLDRVGAFLEGGYRRLKLIVPPEGVPLAVPVSGRGERLGAFMLDLFFMGLAILVIHILALMLLFSKSDASVGLTLCLFIAFIVRNFYFLHFELAWQGRTPGKKICGLRVISRDGGELTPSAVIARNLTREAEFFLPFSLFLSLPASGGDFWQNFTLWGWMMILLSLPLWNRQRLRAGDLIGGTIVVSMPKKALLPDLSLARPDGKSGRGYAFTPKQLSVYGAFELQVLEEFLRRPKTEETARLLIEVCEKIRNKIGWEEEVPHGEVLRFLSDFYAAERADLERRQLFGDYKADKTDTNKGLSQKP